MTWTEWASILLPILFGALLSHAVWATLTILRLRQIVEGSDGKNGLKSDLADLKAWRLGTRPEDKGENLEARCRHQARNIVTEFAEEIETGVRRRKVR